MAVKKWSSSWSLDDDYDYEDFETDESGSEDVGINPKSNAPDNEDHRAEELFFGKFRWWRLWYLGQENKVHSSRSVLTIINQWTILMVSILSIF